MADEWISLARAFESLLEIEQDPELVAILLLREIWNGALRGISRRAFVEDMLKNNVPIPTKSAWFGWPEANPVTFDWQRSRAVSPRGFRRLNKNDPSHSFFRTEYYRVEINISDFEALWPEVRIREAGEQQDYNVFRSGAPGRPTSKHLVECELDRRETEGERCGTIEEWSVILSEWLRVTHPLMPSMKPSTIRNQLRSRLRALVGPAQRHERPK